MDSPYYINFQQTYMVPPNGGGNEWHASHSSTHGYELQRDEYWSNVSLQWLDEAVRHTQRHGLQAPPLNPNFGLCHSRFQFQSPADILGNILMKQLDPTQRFIRSPPRSLSSAPANKPFSTTPSAEGRFPPAPSVPMHTHSVPGPPTRLTAKPIHSTVSSRTTPFYDGYSPPDDSYDIDGSTPTRSKRNNRDDATSTDSKYNFTGAEDMDMDDGQSLKRSHVDDPYAPDGEKRRAASSNGKHLLAMPTAMSRRQKLSSCGSPQGRVTALPWDDRIPSVPTSRPNSFGRHSPTGPLPSGISPTSCDSPHTASISLDLSTQTSIPGPGSIHSGTASGTNTSKMIKVEKPGGTKVQAFVMCKCCPKKPKRFETLKELNAHEAEKQYQCSFCGNHFKNKNEAERHQNSLHVRDYSWSCSALSGYDEVFHNSTNRPGEADTCGYCGDEFPRSGRGPGTGALTSDNLPRHATDQDWDKRITHLQEVHKFRECNSSKKFFRADHFRQHLKHSHAGTSGKWTNMMENACMLEEGPTPR
ncbi:hypothetical protein FOMG_18444 [Fusarium oxysporum f. sp. melonis 26406]|uniref:C2H2-type domain-containing protein n=1 Tax=Fusarium oxysporum f. sp. melonis 26406 TaxID=1089452 RepID=W9Z9B8_FUSOX|nr:hypothetical protein FOMG_18444 [Fusarium oxysporum f. sp. melonis 26406]